MKGASREPTRLAAHLRKLASHSAAYGAGDIASNVVNLLLTPVYTAFLTPADYGIISVLMLFSTVAKIVFRFGLDAGFFRLYYDCATEEERKGLAGTVAFFAAGAGIALFGGVVLASQSIAAGLFASAAPGDARLVVLAAADAYLGTFHFLPLALLRIRDRPRTCAAFLAGRAFLNTVLKVLFVVGGHGVPGVLWSDVIATGALSLALAPLLIGGSRLAFQVDRLRAVLAFGLPKAPHGVLIQVLNLADRRILAAFRPWAVVGVYDKGYTLGAGVKFGLTAFETAWQPFVFSQIRQPDAPATLARVVTYAGTCFVALGLAVAVFGRELLKTLTFKNPAFWAGAPVVPVVVVAYLFHGAFLLTSVGIGIEKKARYYPVVTAGAAGVNLLANFALIPRWGMMGAAWATVLSYAVMAGLGLLFSTRLYPIPFEWGRLARVVLAALASYALSLLAPVGFVPALFVKAAAFSAFPLLLLASGFATR